MHFLFQLILLGAAAFILALGVLWYAEAHPAPVTHQTDAIVVLGAQVYGDGSLSPQLELRMEAALASYQANPRLIIPCGAQGANEPCPEGDAMKMWLVQNGVPAQDILPETASQNTRQNLENAMALLPESARKITVITSDYHLPRAMAIAREIGLEAEGLGSPCKIEYWFKNHSREVLAWGKYLLGRILPLS